MFKILRIYRQGHTDLTDFIFGHQEYRLMARTFKAWKYHNWYFRPISKYWHSTILFQCPWLTLLHHRSNLLH